MKHILTPIKCLIALAFAVLAVSCATTQSTENALVAAGFKVITPTNATQSAKLQDASHWKSHLGQKGREETTTSSRTFLTNQIYVGGPKQYQAYQQNQQAQQLATENLGARGDVPGCSHGLGRVGWMGRRLVRQLVLG